MDSVVSELEGTLLKDPSVFSYFMLVAFETSGLIRFALLLALWPLIRLLEICGRFDDGMKLAIFVSTAGLSAAEVEAVGRAVLPKFMYDDIDMEAWREFSRYSKRVVVTKLPRIMVERFVKEHLRADAVIGRELNVTRFGFATGFVSDGYDAIAGSIEEPSLGMGRPEYGGSLFLHLCKEKLHPPLPAYKPTYDNGIVRPSPVIFHDGRLVKRPTPSTALVVLLWIPLGVLLAFVRLALTLCLRISDFPALAQFIGGRIVVKGTPPPPASASNSGCLFVCTHRSLLDPVMLAATLHRRIPAVTYSLSRFSEIISPIPTIRLTRNRVIDAQKIKEELRKGDLVVCPEGTTCREPFLLRFSALFAELTDRIVPVAMNYHVGFFHATTARGWKALDPIFFLMNPLPVYEVTFLNQLPAEATCSSGKSPQEVANYVQRILAATLGFECTSFTRKDKYRILTGNDGTVNPKSHLAKKMAVALKDMVGCFWFHYSLCYCTL